MENQFSGRRVQFLASRYVERMCKYTGVSPCCFVVAVMYMERLRQRLPSLLLTSRTLQRLLIVAVMTASKFLEDFDLSNSTWWACPTRTSSTHRIHLHILRSPLQLGKAFPTSMRSAAAICCEL